MRWDFKGRLSNFLLSKVPYFKWEHRVQSKPDSCHTNFQHCSVSSAEFVCVSVFPLPFYSVFKYFWNSIFLYFLASDVFVVCLLTNEFKTRQNVHVYQEKMTVQKCFTHRQTDPDIALSVRRAMGVL